MIDPGYLEAGVVGVYGQEFVDQVYGKLAPIDADRIISAEDGFVINLNGRELVCRDTPDTRIITTSSLIVRLVEFLVVTFFGVVYPELNFKHKRLVFSCNYAS